MFGDTGGKKSFLCLKYFGLAESLFLGLQGKVLMMTSSEHELQMC